jgi:hypothetical protein
VDELPARRHPAQWKTASPGGRTAMILGGAGADGELQLRRDIRLDCALCSRIVYACVRCGNTYGSRRVAMHVAAAVAATNCVCRGAVGGECRLLHS